MILEVRTKAPAFVVVFEAEEPVRVCSSHPYGSADTGRAFTWVLSSKSRAMAYMAAVEAAFPGISDDIEGDS